MKKEMVQELPKVKGKINLALKHRQVVFTDFLDPSQAISCSNMIRAEKELSFFAQGGYDDAERKMFIVFPTFISKNEIEVPIALLRIQGCSKSASFDHRDVLGSVLGLGVKREKIGDIIIHPDGADVVCVKEIGEFLNLFLEKVGQQKVKSHLLPTHEIYQVPKQFKEMKVTVPSFRLDAVLSHGISMSRSNACTEIRSGKVKVNHQEVMDIARVLKPGDVISIRGYGRVIFDCVLGSTKKENQVILLKKYI